MTFWKTPGRPPLSDELTRPCQIRGTGVDKFELIGMDACLMGHPGLSALEPCPLRGDVAGDRARPRVGYASPRRAAKEPQRRGGAGPVHRGQPQRARIADEQARRELVGVGEVSSVSRLRLPPGCPTGVERHALGGGSVRRPGGDGRAQQLAFQMQQPTSAQSRRPATPSRSRASSEQVPPSAVTSVTSPSWWQITPRTRQWWTRPVADARPGGGHRRAAPRPVPPASPSLPQLAALNPVSGYQSYLGWRAASPGIALG